MLNTSDPAHAKSLGRKVENFNPVVWNKASSAYMEAALMAKFQQNDDLGTFLKNTGNKLLVEANPTDQYWGVGLSLDDGSLWDQTKWKGKNKLGTLLMEIRDKL